MWFFYSLVLSVWKRAKCCTFMLMDKEKSAFCENCWHKFPQFQKSMWTEDLAVLSLWSHCFCNVEDLAFRFSSLTSRPDQIFLPFACWERLHAASLNRNKLVKDRRDIFLRMFKSFCQSKSIMFLKSALAGQASRAFQRCYLQQASSHYISHTPALFQRL